MEREIKSKDYCHGEYVYIREDENSTEHNSISIYKCNICGDERTVYHPNRAPKKCNRPQK